MKGVVLVWGTWGEAFSSCACKGMKGKYIGGLYYTSDTLQSHLGQKCRAWAFADRRALLHFQSMPALPWVLSPEDLGGGLGNFLLCGWLKGQGPWIEMPGSRDPTASQEPPLYSQALGPCSRPGVPWAEVVAAAAVGLGLSLEQSWSSAYPAF